MQLPMAGRRIWLGEMLLMHLGLAGYVRGPRVNAGDDQRLEAGAWTVDGVAINDSQAEVLEQLGAPTFENDLGQWTVNAFGETGPRVTFDSGGKVMRVSGTTLVQDGAVSVIAGELEQTIMEHLGNGYHIESFAPKGSGMIATGSVFNGARHFFYNDKARFRVFVNRDRVIARIEARRLNDEPKYWN